MTNSVDPDETARYTICTVAYFGLPVWKGFINGHYLSRLDNFSATKKKKK